MQIQKTVQITLTHDEVTKIAKDFVNSNTGEKITEDDIVELRGSRKNATDFLTFKSTDSYEVPVLKDVR